MTCNYDSPKKEPFVSSYDRSVFYTPMYTESNTPTKPIRKIKTEPIKLTVTLKDIGLEGLDSSTPDKTSTIKKFKLQKKQDKQRKSQQKTVDRQQKSLPPPKIRPPTSKAPPVSPRIRKLLGPAVRYTPIYEGTFFQIQKQNTEDPKPIGLLSSSQRSQKPTPIIPITSPKGSPRLNTSGSGIFNSASKNSSDHPIENKTNDIFDTLMQDQSQKESNDPQGEKLTIEPLQKLLGSQQVEEEEEPEDHIILEEITEIFGQQQHEEEENEIAPIYLVNVAENRNNCYDNFWINADRGMPGNPLEKEIKEQEEREAEEFGVKLSIEPLGKLLGSFIDEQKVEENNENVEQKVNEIDDQKVNEIDDQKVNEIDDEHEEVQLEPVYLIDVNEDRNNCYDNICFNIDRGMPGNPLEKELEEQEAREAAENVADSAYYMSLLC